MNSVTGLDVITQEQQYLDAALLTCTLAIQASTECWSPAGWLKAGPLLKSRTVHAQHGILHGQAAQRANAEVSLQLYPSLSLSLMKESSSTYGKKPDLTQQASGADFISDHQAQQYSPSKATACISPDPSADLAGCLQSVVCSTPDQAGNANLQPVPAEQLPLTKAKTCPFTATKACAANQSLQDSDIPGNRQQPSAHQLSYEHRSANTGSAGAAAVPEHARDISRATPEHLCCVQQNESELHIARTQSSGICATDGAAKAEETSHRPSRLLHQPQATQCTPAQQQQPACIRVSLPDGQTDRQRLHQAASCQQQLRAGQTAEGAVCNHQQQQGHSCDTPGTMPSLPQAQAPGMSQMGLAQETVAAAVKHQSQLPEQSAAAMAAWLLQQPELLQGVLDQLEAFAAQGEALSARNAF